MSQPTFVFVHGAWHSPEFFDRVIAILEPLGYKCVTVSMPSVGTLPPVKSLDEDIAAVRSAVLRELDLGNDVVVNAHSWGGIPTCSALDGLSKVERQKAGMPTGVTRLIFAAAFLLPEGMSLQDAIGGRPAWWQVKDDLIEPENPVHMFYHDLDPKDAEKAASMLRPQAVAVFIDKNRSAAWRRITSSYLVCEDDHALPVQGQDAMIGAVTKEGVEIHVERLFSSHSPYFAKPEFVASFLRREAAKGENRFTL